MIDFHAIDDTLKDYGEAAYRPYGNDYFAFDEIERHYAGEHYEVTKDVNGDILIIKLD